MSQNWLITGAGRGFGRAFVSAAAESGAEVYAGVRHVPEGDPLFHSPRVHPLIFDVTKPGEVNAAVEKALGEAGHIDVLINNAGLGMSGAFEEMSDEELRGLMEADYYGAVNVTRAILPSMRGRRGGTILNVASQGGLMGFTGSSAYCSAKFAVVGLSAALRMELQEFGIRVSVLCPGSFRTDFRKKGSMRHPAKALDAYDGTAVRRASRFLAENPDSQKGDPGKAARFIVSMVKRKELPLRILIGADCCRQVKTDLREQIADIESYESLASATDFA